IPVIAEQLNEAIVDFEYHAVRDTADDEGIRTCTECFRESLFAEPERLLRCFAVRDIDHCARDPYGFSSCIVKFPAPVMYINVNAVGSPETVFVRPIHSVAEHKLFELDPDALTVFGVDGIVPIRQSNLQFSGTVAEQWSCRFTPPQLLRSDVDLPQCIVGPVRNAAHPFFASTQGIFCLFLCGDVA